MNNFWTNVFRYPRFFISSFFGLVLVILTPIRNLLKFSKLRIFLLIGIVIIFTLLYFTLIGMLGF